jgi:hypothetical protein
MKGEISISFAVKLIYIIIGLVVVMSFVVYLHNKTMARSYDKAACQLSVIANSKVRMPLTNVDLWRTDCPTRYLRFTKTGYTEESGRQKYTVDFRVGNKKVTYDTCRSDHGTYDCEYLNQVNEAIATHIHDCWEQFMAGQVSVFSDYTSQRQCVICSVFEFSPEVNNKFGDVYSGDILAEDKTLDEYMRNNGPPGRDITYYEYCQDMLDHFNQEYYDYRFDTKYAVVFTAANENYLKTLGQTVLDWVTPNFLKVQKNEDEQRFINTLKYVELDTVSQECDTLVQ